MKVFRTGFCESIRECFDHQTLVDIVIVLQLFQPVFQSQACGNRESAEMVFNAGLGWGDEIRE